MYLLIHCPLQLQSLYKSRSSAIQRCVDQTSERVVALNAQRDSEGETPAIVKELRKEQTKVS